MPMWRRNERPMNMYAAGSKLEKTPTGGGLPALTALDLEHEARASSSMRAFALFGSSNSWAPLELRRRSARGPTR